MIEASAKEVYRILIEECGALPQREVAFVQAFTQPGKNSPREFRINGSLGFGCKFRYPSRSVDCYPEDLTPARAVMIEKANTRLSSLVIE